MLFYDPISDVETGWVFGTGGSGPPPADPPHYQQVDDAVRQPTAPNTADYVRTDWSQGDNVNEEFGLVASSANEITEITVWSYADAIVGSSFGVLLRIGETLTAEQTQTELSSPQWASKTFNAATDPTLFPIAPGTAINLRYLGDSAGPGTYNTVYAAYAEYTESEGGGGGADVRNLVKLPAAQLTKELAA